MLTSCVLPNGTLDNNRAARSMLLHRNTPMHESDLSPAEIIFGRPIHDHFPQAREIRHEWNDIRSKREKTFSEKTLKNEAFYNRTAAKNKKPLLIGDPVAIQDDIHGKRRWQHTGTVVESEPDIRQYMVKVDGSNRITRRNRRHLRPIAENRDTPV